MRALSLTHTDTSLHSVSKLPVCHCPWIEIENIFMFPGQELLPIHGMCALSLGHTDTFGFCIKTVLHFMTPGLRLIIFSCPRDMYQSLFIPFLSCPWNIPIHLHSLLKLSVYLRVKIKTETFIMTPGHALFPVHAMCPISLGHSDPFTFCIKTPVYLLAPGLILKIFSCSRDTY